MNLLNKLLDRWLKDRLTIKVVYRDQGEHITEEVTVRRGMIYRSGTEYLTDWAHQALEKKIGKPVLIYNIVSMTIL